MSQQQYSTTLQEFQDRLQKEWTRDVACQDQCDPPESCQCLRHIIHVDALTSWWRRKVSDRSGTNLHKVLEELQLGKHRTFPLTKEFDTLFEGQYHCRMVFSLLLKQEIGHLIDRFYQSQTYDMVLDQLRSHEELRGSLIHAVQDHDRIESIISDFRHEKWAYCPLRLQLYVDRHLENTKVILPFCHKIRLNDKGGTASVYVVAVQKDLIHDERLRGMLSNSLYTDSLYGECYKLALKSYCGNKISAFESEKDAFIALKSNNEVPIVQYLGSYTHDYGEGSGPNGHLGRTYNLLLEYGELDLDQYWADETNVPPVRAMEIIRYWEKLFEIAVAIRQVHHLDLSQGMKYYGWHADIKPDNILLVNGRFKLADFGYSRFAPVAKSGNGAEPKGYILGFTDTYGAPEISRMKQPNGTTSEVTQTIDTWSFGCVLSVAATWVVLGFQGVRQYATLRKLSSANFKDGKVYDRFHNGTDVLPEVKKWHNYLRGHLRSSDTATASVLELIEHSMLQTETCNRLSMRDLCKRLDKLIKDAKDDIGSLEIHTQNTDALVLQALLKLEKEARELSSRPKTTPLRRWSNGEDGALTTKTAQPESRSLLKEAAIRSIPPGQTAFREELLETELEGKSFTGGKHEGPYTGDHKGELTESPVDAHSMDLPYTRQESPLNKVSSNGHHDEHIATTHPATPTHQGGLNSSQSSSTGNYPAGLTPPLSGSRNFTHRQTTSPPVWPHTPQATRSSPRLTGDFDYQDHVRTEPSFTHELYSNLDRRASRQPPDDLDSPFSTPATSSPDLRDRRALNAAAPQYQHIAAAFTMDAAAGAQENQLNYDNHTQQLRNSVPHIKYPTPKSSQVYATPAPPVSNFHQPGGAFSSASPVSPSITVTPDTGPGAWEASPRTQESESHASDKQVVPSVTNQQSNAVTYDELPDSVYDLEYDICRIRKKLDGEKTKGFRSTLKGVLSGEERRTDSKLKKAYGNDRDIVFVVDNGPSMFKHWPIVTFVLETLAKVAAGLDPDGFDLGFTVDGGVRNEFKKIKGESGRQLLKQALDSAFPANSNTGNASTTMDRIFSSVHHGWTSKGQKPMTLFVLTDGDWLQNNHERVNEVILDFARRDPEAVGRRHVGVQLIRFGDKNIEQLSFMDNQFCQIHHLKDIVDHCSWRSTVDKMFRGSVDGWLDEQDQDERPIKHHYKHITTFFQSFNEGGSSNSAALLSPNGSGYRRPSLSRSSSKSSASDAKKKHESAPPVRSDSWNRQHQRSFSDEYYNKEYE